MRRPMLMLLGGLLLAACREAAPARPTPPPAPTPPSPPPTSQPGDDVARGAYLARIAACVECHTPRTDSGAVDETKLMTGGIPFGGPWGVVHSADVAAVAARFEPRVLEAAIRGQLAWKFQMPTDLYATLASEDLAAIVAWLRTLPSPEVAAPDNQLRYDYRPPPPLPALPHPETAPAGVTVERGEYLTRIAICKDCHTPRKADGTYDEAHALAGGGFRLKLPGGVWLTPPNLTPDVETGLGAWTDEEILTAMREGRARDGRPLHPAMPWAVAYNQMTDDDARAIVKYLRAAQFAEGRAP